MKPIRTIIVDDEPLARENLMLRLQDLTDCDVVAECSGGRDTLMAISKHQPDVLFLDIQMADRKYKRIVPPFDRILTPFFIILHHSPPFSTPFQSFMQLKLGKLPECGSDTAFRTHSGLSRFQCCYRQRRDRVAVPIRKSLLTIICFSEFSSRSRPLSRLFDPYPANRSLGQPGQIELLRDPACGDNLSPPEVVPGLEAPQVARSALRHESVIALAGLCSNSIFSIKPI